MCLCDIRKNIQDILDLKEEADVGLRVASFDHLLDILVLAYELLLHGMPNNLEIERESLVATG